MRHRFARRNGPHLTGDAAIEDLRQKVAHNLRIDFDRIRYGKLGTEDPHWQIFYGGQWRELPWHFDGPIGVTGELVRQWNGEVS